MRVTDQEYMGLAEVAEYLKVSKQFISNWRRRGRLPEPCAQLALGPVWKTAEIIEYFQNIDL